MPNPTLTLVSPESSTTSPSYMDNTNSYVEQADFPRPRKVLMPTASSDLVIKERLFTLWDVFLKSRLY